MSRVMNASVELVKLARSLRGEELVWGETDCATLVRRAARTLYGEDRFAHVGNWTTLRGAARVFRRLSVEDCLRGARMHEVGVAYATTGDVILRPNLDADELPRFAVMLTGGKALVSTREDGVCAVPAREWLSEDGVQVWRFDA